MFFSSPSQVRILSPLNQAPSTGPLTFNSDRRALSLLLITISFYFLSFNSISTFLKARKKLWPTGVFCAVFIYKLEKNSLFHYEFQHAEAHTDNRYIHNVKIEYRYQIYQLPKGRHKKIGLFFVAQHKYL